MKKSLLLLLSIASFLSLNAQYEQIEGQPCYVERYRTGNPDCVTNPADRENITLTGNGVFTILDDNNDTIVNLIHDFEASNNNAFEGEASIGSKYIGYNGFELTPLYYNFVSKDFFNNNKDELITSTDDFFINAFYNETYYLEEKTSGEQFIINVEQASATEITYSYLYNLKDDTCMVDDIAFFYSDSLFYNNEGKLTKRLRNNLFADDLFDFASYYQFQDDDDIELFFQIDSDGDTSQIETRFYNVNDQAYKIEQTIFGNKTTFNLTYNSFGQITTVNKTTIDLEDGDTTDTENETYEYDASGNWVSYIKTDEDGDQSEQQYVTEVLGNNTYKHTDIDLNFFKDGYDTTYLQTQFLESRFKEYNLQFTTLETFIFENDVVITSGKNEFNKYGQLTYSEVLDHEVSPIVKLQSDSIIYEYSSEDELIKTTTYRYIPNNKSYYLKSENTYFCHGETIGDVLAINKNINFTFKLFPNPSSDMVYIESNQDEISLEAYSMDGQLVQTSNTNQINISNLNNGIYMLKVSSNDLTKSVKIIKE